MGLKPGDEFEIKLRNTFTQFLDSNKNGSQGEEESELDEGVNYEQKKRVRGQGSMSGNIILY